ncbi:hypothetical protein FKM82_012991 [Ascaphus truei]
MYITGTGLQCQDCQSYTSTDCTGSLAACSGSATSCMAAVTVITSVPPRNLTPNGVQCPFCIAEASSCTSTGNIACTGLETRCITYSGGIYNGTQFEQKAFKGCTTENVCNVPAPPYPATLLQQGYQLSCTPGATQ